MSVPASAAPTFSVLLIGVSLVVPFLAFVIRRGRLSPHPAEVGQLIER